MSRWQQFNFYKTLFMSKLHVWYSFLSDSRIISSISYIVYTSINIIGSVDDFLLTTGSLIGTLTAVCSYADVTSVMIVLSVSVRLSWLHASVAFGLTLTLSCFRFSLFSSISFLLAFLCFSFNTTTT